MEGRGRGEAQGVHKSMCGLVTEIFFYTYSNEVALELCQFRIIVFFLKARKRPQHILKSLWGHFHNPTDISENCVIRHLKVLYKTILTGRIYPIFFVVQHNLSDCVNIPLI
jgi:hypothetical protein